MNRILDYELVERLLFTAIVVGILMAAGGAVRYLLINNQLSENLAAQIHDDGGEVAIESKSQAQGLMASDIERRRLVSEQVQYDDPRRHRAGAAGLGLAGHGSRPRSAEARGEEQRIERLTSI